MDCYATVEEVLGYGKVLGRDGSESAWMPGDSLVSSLERLSVED